MVCLARNPSQSADTSSAVFVSYDYGRTFVRKVRILLGWQREHFYYGSNLLVAAGPFVFAAQRYGGFDRPLFQSSESQQSRNVIAKE